MESKQITGKECLSLIYAYFSIASFLLLTISKVTQGLSKALDFNPIVSTAIVINLVIFISLYYYKKKHITHHQKHKHV
jgi:hypothetical protein